nr:hypothetical protein [Mannheimia haemolytica]
MQQLIKNIEQWAEDRNLINGSTPQKQMLKLMEGKYSRFFGILHHLALINRFTLNDCLAHAYDQIKDRKGEMQAGIWVKEDDL